MEEGAQALTARWRTGQAPVDPRALGATSGHALTVYLQPIESILLPHRVPRIIT